MARMRGSDEARLAWAIRLAQADLATWRDGDLLNGLDELTSMVHHAGEAAGLVAQLGVVSARKALAPETIRARLTVAQQAFRSLLEAVFAAKDEAARDRVPKPVGVRVDGTRTLSWPRGGAGPLVPGFETRGDNLDRRLGTELALLLADTLARVDVDRLRRCRECGRWFLAERRNQWFDTPRCATRLRGREFFRAKRGRRRSEPEAPRPSAREERPRRAARARG